jgi:tripartite-type tricarboxylate transporter receptor subunit TctC
MVNLSRRKLLRLATGTAALLSAATIARAQNYPSRPVRLVVGFAPGGGNDIVARIMGQWLSERTGQHFYIENRPGAGTNIATEIVVNASPDGYTLLLAGLPNAYNAMLYEKLRFNFIRDIAPVAGIARGPLVMAVHPSVPAKTVPEFIAYAKAHPGKINMASSGTGGGGHLAGELFKMLAGLNLVHVPYRGNGPALTALLGGQVELLFPTLTSSIEYIRTGQLRGLATSGATRSEALPDLPTVEEFVPGYEVSAWYGIGAPKGTPAEVVDKLNKEINAALADAKMKTRFADLGNIPMTMTPAEFRTLIAEETEKWGKVVKFAGIKVE